MVKQAEGCVAVIARFWGAVRCRIAFKGWQVEKPGEDTRTAYDKNVKRWIIVQGRFKTVSSLLGTRLTS